MVIVIVRSSREGENRSMNADAEIRAARAAYNAAIVARDPGAIVACLAAEYELTTSAGETLRGRAALLEHWRRKFERDADVVYFRRPARIDVDDDGDSAEERGTWAGHYTAHGARVDVAGSYTAEWRLIERRWVLTGEKFSAL